MKDDVFEVSLERFKELNSTKHGNLVEEVEESIEELTVAQIKKILDQKGISYTSKDKKEELIKLAKAGD